MIYNLSKQQQQSKRTTIKMTKTAGEERKVWKPLIYRSSLLETQIRQIRVNQRQPNWPTAKVTHRKIIHQSLRQENQRNTDRNIIPILSRVWS